MQFYNRTTEIAELQRIKEMAYNDHSKLTVITGRRRMGKTSLILNALKDDVIDIVAVTLDNKKAFVVEVKRQKKNFKPQLLEAKIEALKTKVLNKYAIDWAYLDITDM
jgi:AAA+ ATPase superfamily predicted ATPase